jgi:hypothetical protein
MKTGGDSGERGAETRIKILKMAIIISYRDTPCFLHNLPPRFQQRKPLLLTTTTSFYPYLGKKVPHSAW